jgi:putative SOS response-associated peptidase YedK
LNTDANDLMKPIHQPMPALALPDQPPHWLDSRRKDSNSIGQAAAVPPSISPVAKPVRTPVSSPKNGVPPCAEASR